jgi:hypothetical protein
MEGQGQILAYIKTCLDRLEDIVSGPSTSVYPQLDTLHTDLVGVLAKLDTLHTDLAQIHTDDLNEQTILSNLLARYSAGSIIVTQVNVLLVSAQLVAANANRKGFVIFNNSANSVYVTEGPTSVAANCTRLIATFTSWENVAGAVWTGAISAIRNSGSGVCTVFELI